MKVFQCMIASLMATSSMAFFAPVRTNLFVAQRSPARAAISPLRMADADLEAKVIDVVGEQLGKKGSVTIDSNFIDDLDADSLDTIELIMSLEEEFGIEIAEEEAQKMLCVRDAVTYIEANK